MPAWAPLPVVMAVEEEVAAAGFEVWFWREEDGMWGVKASRDIVGRGLGKFWVLLVDGMLVLVLLLLLLVSC